MRYVGNALDGKGFVYNQGESSHGVTSFLWPLVMFPIVALLGNTIYVWKICGVLSFACGVLFIYLTLNRGTPLHSKMFAVLPVVLAPFTLRWSGTGLENGLVVLFIGLFFLTCRFDDGQTGSTLVCTWRMVVLGALASALPFVRPELGLMAAACLFVLLFLHSSKAIKLFLLGAIPILLLLCFSSLATFGSIIPQTAEAKALALEQSSNTYALRQTTGILVFGSGLGMLCLALNWRTLILYPELLASVIGVVAGSVLYLIYRNHLVSTRYATYLVVPVLALLSVLLARVLRDDVTTNKIKIVSVCIVCLQLLVAAGVLIYFFPATRTLEGQTIKTFAESVRLRTDSQARVALSEIGAFGFYSRRYIIDLVGLVDGQTLEYYRHHGNPPRVLGNANFDSLLRDRNATHYVDVYSVEPPERIVGSGLTYILLETGLVERNNLSSGRHSFQRWSLYAVQK